MTDGLEVESTGIPARRRSDPMASHVSFGHVPWTQEVALETIQADADLRGPLLPVLLALRDAFGYVDPRAVRSLRRHSTSRAPTAGSADLLLGPELDPGAAHAAGRAHLPPTTGSAVSTANAGFSPNGAG
jgi:hypothetical protein